MTIKNLFYHLFLLIKSRREILYVWSFCVMTGAFLAAKGFPPVVPTLLATVGTMCTTFSVYLYNDLLDAAQDQLNPLKRTRPLAQGALSEGFTKKVILISAIIGLVLLYWVHVMSFVFGLLYYVLFFIYSFRPIYLKKRTVLKELSIALALPLNGLVGMYAATGSFSAQVLWALIALAAYGFAVQPAVVDTTDMKEDKLAGVKTLGVVLNWPAKVALAVAGYFINGLLIVWLYLNYDFHFLLPVITLPMLLLLMMYFIIYQKQIKNQWMRGRLLVHVYHFTLTIVLIVSAALA